MRTQIKIVQQYLSIVSLSGIQEAIRCNWQSFRMEYSLGPTIKTKQPIVPTGEPLQVNTHYYAIFWRTQPTDIPYAHMRRQISVIKGCKVDLQLGSEYRTLGNASTNSEPRRASARINLLETNENRGCGGFGLR